MLSATIIVPRTEFQERSSGDTPSPTLTPTMSSTNTSKKSKGNKVKDSSPDNIISLDEVINMPKWDLSFLEAKLAKKKKQEEMKTEQQQNKVLHGIKDIFIDSFDI